jgi:hypothetical protein
MTSHQTTCLLRTLKRLMFILLHSIIANTALPVLFSARLSLIMRQRKDGNDHLNPDALTSIFHNPSYAA